MAEEDFDDVLNILGLGKWNLLYYFSLGLCNFMHPGFVFAGGFIAPSLEFYCDTQNIDEFIQDQDQCIYVVRENTTLGEESEMERKCSEWIYTGNYSQKTLTAEFDLVCDKAYLRPTIQTVFMVGNLIGSPVTGFLSDRYGRKKLMIFTSLISVGSMLILTISTNLTAILILRFLTGMTCQAVHCTGFILSMEVCEPKHRTVVGIILSVPWALGTAWWGVLGYLIEDWRWLMRAITIPAVVFYICLCLMNESPRWLIVNGYHTRALIVLKKAAKWNHCSLPPDEELLKRMVAIQKTSKCLSESKEKARTSPSFGSRLKEGMQPIIILYKTPELRRRILVMSVVFFASDTVFFGLTLNAVNFQVDPFMYIVISGLIEIPSYTITIPITKRFGRVPPTAACYFISGLAILTLGFIPSDPKWLIITLAMIGRFCICASFQLIILVLTEVLPTEVRSRGTGAINFVATIGAIIAPFITDLIGNRYAWIPSIIFGGFGLMGGVTSLFIPETLNKHLLETVMQLEKDAIYKKTRRNKEENEAFEITVNNSAN